MSGPYFQHDSWPDFVYQEESFSLAHLDEGQIEVEDSEKHVRRIAITYGDHCFTREPEDGDDPALSYPHSSRSVGHFCFERYELSLGLPGHIGYAALRKVWTLRDDAFAVLPTVDHRGNSVLYGIVFDLKRVWGLPVDLRMRVKSAHPRTDIITFGDVRFSYLVTLRMQGKNPPRHVERHRNKPGWKPGQR